AHTRAKSTQAVEGLGGSGAAGGGAGPSDAGRGAAAPPSARMSSTRIPHRYHFVTLRLNRLPHRAFRTASGARPPRRGPSQVTRPPRPGRTAGGRIGTERPRTARPPSPVRLPGPPPLRSATAP